MTKPFFSQKIVLFLAFVSVIIPVSAIEYSVLKQTNGVFMYPLDDVYIHMALAKNLAFFQTWGISRFEFASASSSILYTFLLAGLFKIFSVHTIIPFLINCTAGCVLLAVLQKWLRKENIQNGPQLVVLLCIVFFSPLPILLLCGMEHTLQCLFAFLFIFGFSDWLETTRRLDPGNWKLPWELFLYGMLVTGVRYEGLFLVAIACLILAYYRKWTLAFKLGLIAMLPLVIFGIYSILKGSYFLPNSVLLKSESAPLSLRGALELMNNILVQKLTVVKTDNIPAGTPRPGISLLATQRLLIILPLAWFSFRKYIRERPAYGFVLLILTACTLLQLSFAATGWLYRYEAYLIFCSVLIISVLIYKYGRDLVQSYSIPVCLMIAVGLFGLGFPLVLRSIAAFTKTGTACINIYQQQYQMGLFSHQFYDREPIAVNDIGAVSFFTSGHNLDLWGLGNIRVARSKKNKSWTPDFLDSFCRNNHAKLAIVYESWFNDSLLHRWSKVATWQIQHNVICGDDQVSFFAIDPETAPALKRDLMEFQKKLPESVAVKYYY